MKNRESYHSFKKYDVFCQSWEPDSKNDDTHILIVHGLGEHSSSYTNFGKSMSDKGVSCHSYDLIGHGQTSGQRGYVPNFDTFVEQFETQLQQILSAQVKSENLTIFAHSMGGLIVLKSLYQQTIPENIKIIFSNPLVKINVEIPEWKLTLAQGLSQILPRFSLFNEINDLDLTKDESAIENYSKDPLRHKKISIKLFLELEENTDFIQKKFISSNNQTLFLLSTNDKVCDPSASQELSKKFSNSELELFPQSGHEIINDLSKNRAIDRISNFIKGTI